MKDQKIIIEQLAELVKDLKKVVSLLAVRVPPPDPNYNPWIDKQKVAKLLGVSDSTVKRHTEEGKFITKRYKKKISYYEPDILEKKDIYIK